MGPPRVSVVIPTLRGRATLPEVLRGLARQTERDFEALIVQDGGRPPRGLRAPFPIRVLSQPHSGAGPARNLGVREARGRVVVFLADDVIPDAFLIASHLSLHRGGPARAAVGMTAWHPALRLTPLMRRIAPEGDLTPFHLASDPGDLDYGLLFGSNLSLPRRLALRFPFDPGFSGYGWEDTELGYRLSRAGVRIVLAPGAVGWHRHAYTAAAWASRRRKARKAFLRFLRLHPEEGSRLISAHRKALDDRDRRVRDAERRAADLLRSKPAWEREVRLAREAASLARREVLERARESGRLRGRLLELQRLLPRELEHRFWSGASPVSGWHPWEGLDAEPFRWSRPRAALRIPSGPHARWTLELGTTRECGVRRLEILARKRIRTPLGPGRTRVDLGTLPPGTLLRMRASPPGRAPGDPRTLGIQLFAVTRST